MRKILIAGNWKMNSNRSDAVTLASAVAASTGMQDDVDVLMCPPHVYLSDVLGAVAGSTAKVGAQNMSPMENGAFTGEISAAMLVDVGCSHVILGHSERRQYYHETDDTVNEKIKAALKAGLVPVMCIGESLAERKAGKATEVVTTQLANGLHGLSLAEGASVVFAYEPVWAIGTGVTASPTQAQDMHRTIRDWIAARFDEQVADEAIILYGGSMKPDNARDLLSCPDIDGGLIGGASLKAASFTELISIATRVLV